MPIRLRFTLSVLLLALPLARPAGPAPGVSDAARPAPAADASAPARSPAPETLPDDPAALADRAARYLRGDGVPQDYAIAADLSRRAAARGEVRGMIQLGWIHLEGKLGSADPAEARRWFEQAAARGNIYAERKLGDLYANGRGVTKDPAQAFRWYERAARQGDPWAQVKVGFDLSVGNGIERDDEEAVVWFRFAAGHGDPWGEYYLGDHYLTGRGVPKDAREAFIHLAAASRRSNEPMIAYSLSNLFRESAHESFAGFRDLLRSCIEDPTLPQAKGTLPEMCLGAIDLAFKSEADAVAGPYLQRLIAADRPQAAADLAWHAFTAWHMSYDLARARTWARAAATVESRRSAYLVAAIDSVAAAAESERAAARRDLRQLADDGYAAAAYLLAQRYAAGEGEPYDPAAALRYFNLSVGRATGEYADTSEAALRALHLSPLPPEPTAPELAALAARLPDAGPTATPQPLYQPPPRFPFDLQRSGFAGEAAVEFVVDTRGRVRDVKVMKATHPLFAAAAVAAVRRWRFVPGRQAGALVNTKMAVPLIFNLDDSLPPPAATPPPPP